MQNSSFQQIRAHESYLVVLLLITITIYTYALRSATGLHINNDTLVIR